MPSHVCPPIVGYLLLNPLRKLVENPEHLFKPFVREGMTVLEPGCGMGFFTLPLARMVGRSGKVVAVDIQERMLEKVQKWALRAGLDGRIDCIQARGSSLSLEDISGKADLALALYVIHEVPDQRLFFTETFEAIKPGGEMLVYEPAGHVTEIEFNDSISLAESVGFEKTPTMEIEGRRGSRRTVLRKPSQIM